MGRVYFFPSQTFIHNDKVFPIVLGLAHQGHHVETIILSGEVEFVLRDGSAYAHWLSKLTRIRRYAFDHATTITQRLCVRIRFVHLLLTLAFRRGYLAFLDSRHSSKPSRVLNWIANRNGTVVIFTAWYLNPLHDINWAAVLADPQRRRRMKGTVESAVRTAPLMHEGTTLLCYHPNVVEEYREIHYQRLAVLPHPKLQPWWRSFMVAHPLRYDHDALAHADRWVAIFLTHRGNYMFREDSDADVLLEEILRVVRRVFPNMLIAIKPKANIARSQEEWLRDIVQKYGDQRTIFTTTPVSFLAERAVAGITTGHTTAQFEFMTSDAPWIEYCRYSIFWEEIYAQKTYTPQYGGTWVETPDALEVTLRNLHRHGGDRRQYEALLAFHEVPLSFDFFRGSA